MWCSSCEQDVPGVASVDGDKRICCARCGESLSSGAALSATLEIDEAEQPETESVAPSVEDTDQPSATPILDSESLPPHHSWPPQWDDWEFEEDLQSVERRLRVLRAQGIMPAREETSQQLYFDEPHSAVPNNHLKLAAEKQRSKSPPSLPRAKRRKSRSAFFSWAMISFGLMTFVCGAVLMGWSIVTTRVELWTIGTPLTLGGQAVLIIGLIFQLENLWQSSRETTTTLDELDEQLHDLRQSATLLGPSQPNPAKSFYLHMAEGATPQMLLADLKGQLDMLAVRMAQEKG